jgi:hypothetical protein
MPGNPYKEDQACYKWLVKRLESLDIKGCSYSELLIDCLTLFAISESKIDKFLKFHVKTGRYFIKKDCIYKLLMQR